MAPHTAPHLGWHLRIELSVLLVHTNHTSIERFHNLFFRLSSWHLECDSNNNSRRSSKYIRECWPGALCNEVTASERHDAS